MKKFLIIIPMLFSKIIFSSENEHNHKRNNEDPKYDQEFFEKNIKPSGKVFLRNPAVVPNRKHKHLSSFNKNQIIRTLENLIKLIKRK